MLSLDPNLSFEEEEEEASLCFPPATLPVGGQADTGEPALNSGQGQGGAKRGPEADGAAPPLPGYYTALGRQQLHQQQGGQQGLGCLGAGFGGSGFPGTSWSGQASAGGWVPGQGIGFGEVLEMVVGAVTKIKSMEGGGEVKRRKKDEVDDKDVEEPLVPVVFKGLDGEDDGIDRICWDIRTRLRPYVGSQEEFWSRQPRVVHPLRESYDTSFLRMDPVNSQVTLRDHDRGATRTIKQYFKHNIRVERTKLLIGAAEYEANDVGLRREYVESTGVYQVISGVWQYQSNLWMIRRDDHSGVLILRLLHDVKFFLPTLLAKFPDKAVRDKKQLEVVNYFVDEFMRQNSQRGRQGKAPLNYDEGMKVAKSALNSIYAGSGVGLSNDFDFDAYSFDPYTAGSVQDVVGGGGGTPKNRSRNRGNKANAGAGSATPAAGTGAAAGGSGASSGGGGGGPLPCRAWNAGNCTWNPCKFKHFCNKVLQGGGFCKQIHRAKDHK